MFWTYSNHHLKETFVENCIWMTMRMLINTVGRIVRIHCAGFYSSCWGKRYYSKLNCQWIIKPLSSYYCESCYALHIWFNNVKYFTMILRLLAYWEQIFAVFRNIFVGVRMLTWSGVMSARVAVRPSPSLSSFSLLSRSLPPVPPPIVPHNHGEYLASLQSPDGETSFDISLDGHGI